MARKKKEAAKEETKKVSEPIVVEAKMLPKEELKRVWMGVTDDCPFQNVVAGGMDFSMITENVKRSKPGTVTERNKQKGKVVEINDRRVGQITAAVQRKVLRNMGARSFILNIDDKRYKPNERDMPLGCFLYMVILGDKVSPDWRDKEPPPMTARPKKGKE